MAELTETTLPLSTGLKDLDVLIGGIKMGRSVVFGARPGNGKTTLAEHLLNTWFERGHTVCYIGTELSPETMYTKWAASRLRLDVDAVLCGRWADLPEGAKESS